MLGLLHVVAAAAEALIRLLPEVQDDLKSPAHQLVNTLRGCCVCGRR